jgi:thioredoxin reductase (NADPH)
MENVKVLIVGSGPAGCTAAIYAGRANLSPVLYEGNQPGGQLTTTSDIENFPGYPEGINGTAMMADIAAQAKRFGADIRSKEIVKMDLTERPFKVEDEDGNQILAETIILATGASAKYLGLPDEEKYKGQGVSACAVCDGFFYRKRVVAVVGGGDSACEEALYLSTLAKKVYLVVRKNYLRASEVMKRRVEEKENIEILYNCNTKSLSGEDGLEAATLVRYAGTPEEEEFTIDIDGFFLGIGHNPNTKLFAQWVELDELGYVKVAPYTSETNVKGVFAAGDVCDPRYRQAITAAGSGCKAALDAERFLANQ